MVAHHDPNVEYYSLRDYLEITWKPCWQTAPVYIYSGRREEALDLEVNCHSKLLFI